MAVAHNLALPLLVASDADTLVYIDPAPEAKALAATRLIMPQLGLNRVHSQKLLDTGSDYLKCLFDPRVQSRAMRRRFPSGLPSAFQSIKYVLDLTPPEVDEEAVIFLAELSCPLGVRVWARSRARWGLPSSRVEGVDETDPADPEMPLEYSQARHRTGIERVLHALEGQDPCLDTPCKMWTFFALARLFGVAAAPRAFDHILSWFFEPNNATFIQVNPELTYRIACGIRYPVLCRDAFAILVGEEALHLLLDDQSQGRPRAQATRYGRLRETLDDTELQRIEYASKSFLDHVLDRFVYLAGTTMPWLETLPEYRKILDFSPATQEQQVVVVALVDTAKSYIRALIYQMLRPQKVLPLVGLVTGTLKDGSFQDYPGATLLTAYNRMPSLARILTRTSWENLVSDTLASDQEHLYIRKTSLRIPEHAGLSATLTDQLCLETRPVLVSEVSDATEAFREISFVQSGTERQQRLRLFSWPQLITEVTAYVNEFAQGMLAFPEAESKSYGFRFAITATLTCLTENEFQFLPLWAGGNDDGTGGVFQGPPVPLMETGGFSAPGPSVHTGSVAATSDLNDDDDFSEIHPDDAVSTVLGASHRATEGHTDEVVSVNEEVVLVEALEGEALDWSQLDHVSNHLDLDGSDDDTIMGSPETVGLSDGELVDDSDDDWNDEHEHDEYEHDEEIP
ncbi:hypothetical protein ASPZODRAFT_70726 [Penicilliopsis zonata CBS 506.65]|uniref:Uncharacterized protein n=1 Tax=Penicilliopsis zonata CBS 506.65 TaxID=1073090 RepID=A0A1L9SD15_9EURO|nr:hypothetical protein ASPZODRAFT_70726 [Penicilliopsis zonata CBS 506.65]OJJ45012.1 hypothetical protein ASPZODRAFT_70726 [Penicilliopsis zonata CBS 506.65]